VLVAKTDPWLGPPCYNLNGLTIGSDGRGLIAACGAPYYASSYSLNGLALDATYSTGPYPQAVAIAQDGRIAVAASSIDAALYVFSPSVSSPASSYTLSDTEGSETAGLAWGDHDRQLFAVTVDTYGDNPILNTINYDTH
jgi:hypothetical protein